MASTLGFLLLNWLLKRLWSKSSDFQTNYVSLIQKWRAVHFQKCQTSRLTTWLPWLTNTWLGLFHSNLINNKRLLCFSIGGIHKSHELLLSSTINFVHAEQIEYHAHICTVFIKSIKVESRAQRTSHLTDESIVWSQITKNRLSYLQILFARVRHLNRRLCTKAITINYVNCWKECFILPISDWCLTYTLKVLTRCCLLFWYNHNELAISWHLCPKG